MGGGGGQAVIEGRCMQQVLLVFHQNLEGGTLPAPSPLVPTVLHSNRVATLKASAFVGWDGWGMTPSFNLHGLPPHAARRHPCHASY